MTVKSAYFEITNQCNLNCATCYNRSGMNTAYAEISAAQMRSSIEILSKYGLEHVFISGGEPALHSEFDGILELVNEYQMLSFGIVTNGTVHNRKLIDMLNRNDNFTLQISLDGSTDEINGRTRGMGNFDKTITFARQIHKQNPSSLLKMVVSQNNIDDIADFYSLAAALDFTPEFAFITHLGNAGDGWEKLCLSPKQRFKVLKQIDGLNKEYGKEAVLPLCTAGCPYSGREKSLSLCIKTDGAIQPCSLLYTSEHSAGNIFEFDEAYFFERISYITDLAVRRKSADYNCGKCILRGGCKKGCMAYAFILNGDVLAADGDCELRKMQFIGIGFDLPNLRQKQ